MNIRSFYLASIGLLAICSGFVVTEAVAADPYHLGSSFGVNQPSMRRPYMICFGPDFYRTKDVSFGQITRDYGVNLSANIAVRVSITENFVVYGKFCDDMFLSAAESMDARWPAILKNHQEGLITMLKGGCDVEKLNRVLDQVIKNVNRIDMKDDRNSLNDEDQSKLRERLVIKSLEAMIDLTAGQRDVFGKILCSIVAERWPNQVLTEDQQREYRNIPLD